MVDETLTVIIGRFQPFHRGHRKLFEHASTISKNALVLIGSAFRPRSARNAFLWDERANFIQTALKSAGIDIHVTCLPLVDTLYDDATWAGNVRTAIDLHMRTNDLDPKKTKIVLVGNDQEESSRYLNAFPEYETMIVEAATSRGVTLNAADLRDSIFMDKFERDELCQTYGTAEIYQIMAWMEGRPDAVQIIREEAEHCKMHRINLIRSSKGYGHEIPVNYANAIVVQNGHILLVERLEQPGSGKLALPGVQLCRESALDAAIRGVFESTNLDVDADMLKEHLVSRQVFDHLERSERGWLRTEALNFELIDGKDQEKISAGDGVKDAMWMPINQLTPDVMFEDHFDIIQSMVPIVPFAYSSVLMSQFLFGQEVKRSG